MALRIYMRDKGDGEKEYIASTHAGPACPEIPKGKVGEAFTDSRVFTGSELEETIDNELRELRIATKRYTELKKWLYKNEGSPANSSLRH